MIQIVLTGFNQLVTDLRHYWCECFGELYETKRCDTFTLMCGFIVSAKTGEFNYFDKRYERLKQCLKRKILF